MTERKRRGPNKPIKSATKDYRNTKKDSQSNETLYTKEKTKIVLAYEKPNDSSSKSEQLTTITGVRNGFLPESLGSSIYGPVPQMKESANIKEDDLKSAISNVQKNESIKGEDICLQRSNINEYQQSMNPITIMQEETSISGGSREGSYYHDNSLNGENPFMDSMIFWHSSMISWFGMYNDFSENVTKMIRDYWKKASWISHKGEWETSTE
ncbi:MAG TPA: hypothetical protein VFI73_14725 [Candidatus Nitrosopolaris sp.]|nr:hypothetical protein [Candidatus Nitrosopolaris sp.]